MESWRAFAQEWWPNPWVQAVVLVVGSFLVAWVVDFVLVRILLSLANRTFDHSQLAPLDRGSSRLSSSLVV